MRTVKHQRLAPPLAAAVSRIEEQMSDTFSRRNFLKSSAAVGAAATIASLGTNYAHAQGQGRIKVGLVGCGGRGTGAATDAIHASSLVDIVAMGDLFKDHLEDSRKNLLSVD